MARVETTQEDLKRVQGLLNDTAAAIASTIAQMRASHMKSIPIHASALEKNVLTLLQTCNRIKVECDNEVMMQRLGAESPIRQRLERLAKESVSGGGKKKK